MEIPDDLPVLITVVDDEKLAAGLADSFGHYRCLQASPLRSNTYIQMIFKMRVK